jgi:phytol kinase
MSAVIASLVALAALLISVRLWQHRHKPHPELARKALHIGVGVIGLSFPFSFGQSQDAVGLVWLTCGVASLTMLGIRLARPLQRGFGAVLGSVNRVSTGEFYFLLGLAALYTISSGGPLYGTALAILTFADAGAALSGVFWGKRRYSDHPDAKSLEGSVVFWALSLIFCLLGLLVNGLNITEAVLIAMVVALMGTLLEAVAQDGLDNLLLPVMTYILLRGLTGLEALALAVALSCTVVVAAQVVPRRLWKRLESVAK